MLVGKDDVVLDWFADGEMNVNVVAVSISEDGTGILRGVIFAGLESRGICVLIGGDDVALGLFADGEAKVVAVSTSKDGTGI